MPEPRYTIEELEVIGFADSLNEFLVPRRVRPIFRVRNEPERVLIPPFEIEGDFVVGAIPGGQPDLDRAVRRGQATRLESAIPARSDHELWIDEELQPHYGTRDEALEKLRRMAHKKAREALRLVLQGKLDEAEHLAQAAISADDGCLNAILVKATIDRIQGHDDSLGVLVDVAETIVPGADFGAWIDFFSDLVDEKSLLEQTTDGFQIRLQPTEKIYNGRLQVKAELRPEDTVTTTEESGIARSEVWATLGSLSANILILKRGLGTLTADISKLSADLSTIRSLKYVPIILTIGMAIVALIVPLK